jgi:hypothetical protein
MSQWLDVPWGQHPWDQLVHAVQKSGRRLEGLYIDNQLPIVPDQFPTVMLPHETLSRFRADFATLLGFAAVVCDVSPDNLSPATLIRHLSTEKDRALKDRAEARQR